mmetsp:Transcript_49078/g.59445  ORF Transcript_49078/g.59445 Transcript_49078/m.59445 type:complete len:309 (-) Transcript_49078:224-1150(-)
MKLKPVAVQIFYISLFLFKETLCTTNYKRRKHSFNERTLRTAQNAEENGRRQLDGGKYYEGTEVTNPALALGTARALKSKKISKKTKTPRPPPIEPSMNETSLKESCPASVTNTTSNPTNGTTLNVTETQGEITYKYSIDSVTPLSNETERLLKETMFQGLVGHICPSRRRLRDMFRHRRRLEVVDIESALRDIVTGSCTPQSGDNNTCTKYKGVIDVLINNIGDNDDMKETTANVMAYLEEFAKSTNWSAISDNILGMAVSTTRQTNPPDKIEQQEGLSPGTIAGMVAGVAALAALLFGIIYMKQRR